MLARSGPTVVIFVGVVAATLGFAHCGGDSVAPPVGADAGADGGADAGAGDAAEDAVDAIAADVADAASTHVPINTLTGWSDSPFISRDGKRLYFMYSRYDFGKFIASGGQTLPPLTGPDRAGLHHSASAFDESDIFVATKNDDGSWGEAVALDFNGAYGDSSGMEIDGSDSFVWLRGNGTTNDIVTSRRTGGVWSAPAALSGVNDDTGSSIQDNPMIDRTGTLLWFTSSRDGGVGGKDIWFSSQGDGGLWSAPHDLGAPFDTAGDEDQFFVSQVGADIYWNGPAGIMHCIGNGSGCTNAPNVVAFAGSCGFAAEVSATDDGNYLYFACVDATTYRIRIMYTQKQSGAWGPPTPVD